MFTQEELVKIHNTLINSPMVEVEGIISKIRQYFKEQEEVNKAPTEQTGTEQNEKTE